VQLKFANWKGARLGVFCYGANGGAVDVDYVRYGAAIGWQSWSPTRSHGGRLSEMITANIGTEL